MFCTKCGAQNADGAKFCNSCGADLTAAKNEGAKTTVNATAPKSVATTNNTTKKKGSGKLIGIALLLVLVLVGGLVIKSKLGSSSSDSNGNDSKTESSKSDSGKKNKKSDNEILNKDMVTSYKQLSKEDIEELHELCNGKLATEAAHSQESDFTIVEKAELVGYIFVAGPQTSSTHDSKYNMNHLTFVYKEVVNQYDRDVTYYMAYDFSQIKKENGEFTYLDEDSGTIGDDYSFPLECYHNSLTSAFVDVDKETADIQADGIFEKYIGCEMIESLSDISKKGQEALIEDAKNRILTVNVNYPSDVPVFSDLNYEGQILVNYTDGSTYASPDGRQNFYVIFTATVTSTDGEYPPTKLFIPVGYTGIYKLKNGDFDYVGTTLKIEGEAYGYYFGYETDEEMYRDLVSDVRSYATYELSESMKYLDEKYKLY